MTAAPKGLAKGTRIGEGINFQRWQVTKKLGEGGFAEVYEVLDSMTNEKMAMKIDKLRPDPRGGTVKMEYKVMSKLQQCPYVCRVSRDGQHDGRHFMIMELLGVNLAQSRSASPAGRFSGEVVKIVGLQLLKTLEGIHKLGYIHRDVKPANFGLTPIFEGPRNGKWRTFDFGIARKFIDESGKIIPAREDFKEFRGSTTYASVHAHAKQDLGRRDDLWSWFYIVVELLYGTLPWRTEKGTERVEGVKGSPREAVSRKKHRCLANPHELAAFGSLPDGLVQISNYLRRLGFSEEPDYEQLAKYLSSIPANLASGPSSQPASAQPLAPHPTARGRSVWDPAMAHALPHSPVLPPQALQAFTHHYHYADSYPAHPSQPVHRHSVPTAPMGYPPHGSRTAVPVLESPESPSEEATGVPGLPSTPWAQNGQANETEQLKRSRDAEWEADRNPTDHDFYSMPASKQMKWTVDRVPSCMSTDIVAPLPGRTTIPLAERLAEVHAIVGEVQRGNVSQRALEVKERLRMLDPAEGMGVIGWMLNRMEYNFVPQHLDKVALWMEELAAYTQERARSCWAKYDAS